MIIGISGKVGSGKDEVANIIQRLAPNTSFKTHRFADKIKDMVCVLLDCTREQLEDRVFKNTPLGENWRYWKPAFVGNSKDEASYNEIFTTEEEAVDFLFDKGYSLSRIKVIPFIHTPRSLFISLGTTWGRQMIHPNIWVNSLLQKYVPYSKGVIAPDSPNLIGTYMHTECRFCKKGFSGLKRQLFCSTCFHEPSIQIYPNWIIPDVRFISEAEGITNLKQPIIRVDRLNNPHTEEISKDNISETELDSYPFDYVIKNDGSLRDLEESVKKVLTDIFLFS